MTLGASIYTFTIYTSPKETSSSEAKTNLSQGEVSTLKEPRLLQPGLCQLNDGLLLDEVDEDLGGYVIHIT